MRKHLFVLIAATAIAVASAPPATARFGINDHERAALAEINAQRDAAGLAPLRWGRRLSEIARRQSGRMARSERLSHTPRLGRLVRGWSYLTENVGVGPDVPEVSRALMESASHRRNVLGRATKVGVGVVVSDGVVWVTQIFFRR